MLLIYSRPLNLHTPYHPYNFKLKVMYIHVIRLLNFYVNIRMSYGIKWHKILLNLIKYVAFYFVLKWDKSTPLCLTHYADETMSDPGNANDWTPVACQFTWTRHVRLTKYIDTMISLMNYSFLSLVSKISLVGR